MNCCICGTAKEESDNYGIGDQASQLHDVCEDELEKQLKTVYFVRYIIGVSAQKCEDFLKKYGNPEKWIEFCSPCLSMVEESRSVFENVVRLQSQHSKIREKIKSIIVSSTKSTVMMAETEFFEEMRQILTEDNNDLNTDSPQDFMGLHSLEDHSEEVLPESIIGPENNSSLEDDIKPNVEDLNIARANYLKSKAKAGHRRRLTLTFEQVLKKRSDIIRRSRKNNTSTSSRVNSLSTLCRKYGVRKFPCDNCGKVLPTYTQWRLHSKQHAASIQYASGKGPACEICSDTFPRPLDVENHTRYMHFPKEASQCEGCHVAFRRLTEYKNHLLHNAKPECSKHVLKCELCPSLLMSSDALELHKKLRHTNHFKPNLKCMICGKGYITVQSLNLHAHEVHFSENGGNESQTGDSNDNDNDNHVSSPASGSPSPSTSPDDEGSNHAFENVQVKVEEAPFKGNFENACGLQEGSEEDTEAQFDFTWLQDEQEQDLNTNEREPGIVLPGDVDSEMTAPAHSSSSGVSAAKKTFFKKSKRPTKLKKTNKQPRATPVRSYGARRETLTFSEVIEKHKMILASLGPVPKNPTPEERRARNHAWKTSSLGYLSRVHFVTQFPCEKCSEVMDTYNKWKQHMKEHFQEDNLVQGDGIQCQECPKAFITTNNLEYHVRCVHASEELSRCGGCGKVIKSPSRYNTHVKENPESVCHQKAIKCNKEKCRSYFPNSESYDLHLNLRHNSSLPAGFKCRECGAEFNTSAGIVKHARHVHGLGDKGPLICELCGNKYSRPEGLRCHIKNVHELKEPGAKVYTCDVCGKTTTVKANWRKHIKIHSTESPYLCTICGKTFKIRNYLTIHMWSHDPDRKNKYSPYMPKKSKANKQATT